MKQPQLPKYLLKKIRFKFINNLHIHLFLIKETSNKIFLKLVEVQTHQTLGRFKQSRDEYVLIANNSLIFYWSLFQSILIIICGIFQVYFIKRLFNVHKKNIK